MLSIIQDLSHEEICLGNHNEMFNCCTQKFRDMANGLEKILRRFFKQIPACALDKEWMVLIYWRDSLVCQVCAPEEVIRVTK